jgi:penicillin-binding protein 2
MSSSPRFDPNIFSGEISTEVWKDLVSGPGKKLTNRGVQGAYPPGSVFKAIMGAAGLSEGVITPQDRVTCVGGYRFGSRTYHCHKRTGHGPMNLYDSLVQSCDIFYYQLGQRLGVDGIYEYATRFGLGRKSGLELVHENPGLIPSTRWKAKAFAGTEQARWWPGETLSVSIGQGATLATPLQMANAVAALVNGGKVYRPHLVRKVLKPNGSVIHGEDDFKPKVISELKIDDKALREIQNGLFGVVNNPRGTGRRALLPKEWNISVAGKTGTSQVVALTKKTTHKHLEHHAWFVGYAPAENPEIVVAALIENGGGGGLVAAPVVQQVLHAFFEPRFPIPRVEPETKPAQKENENAP